MSNSTGSIQRKNFDIVVSCGNTSPGNPSFILSGPDNLDIQSAIWRSRAEALANFYQSCREEPIFYKNQGISISLYISVLCIPDLDLD